MSETRRRVLVMRKFLLIAVLTLFCVSSCAFGAEWPDGKPLTMLCGYSAGGSSDIMSRYVAAALQKVLGVPVIVENVPGSGSWIAWNRLLHNTPADGYTFALVNLSAVLGHYDAANPREDTIDSFDLLANVAIDYQIIGIRADETRFSDYKSLIEYGQKNTIVIAAASTGITSGDGSIGKYLEKKHGCKVVIVPTDGAGDAETMFLAGEVDILIGNVGDVSGAEDNGYKVVVVYAPERSPYIPDVPTEKELGLGEYLSFSARGYTYMPGVDPAIKAKMMDAFMTIKDDDEFKKNMDSMFCQMEFMVGDEYKARLNSVLEDRLALWDVQK